MENKLIKLMEQNDRDFSHFSSNRKKNPKLFKLLMQDAYFFDFKLNFIIIQIEIIFPLKAKATFNF